MLQRDPATGIVAGIQSAAIHAPIGQVRRVRPADPIPAGKRALYAIAYHCASNLHMRHMRVNANVWKIPGCAKLVSADDTERQMEARLVRPIAGPAGLARCQVGTGNWFTPAGMA